MRGTFHGRCHAFYASRSVLDRGEVSKPKLMEIARNYMAKFFPKTLGYHGDIERKQWANLDTGCTYPAELVIYREIKGEWYEEQRITLAQWKAA